MLNAKYQALKNQVNPHFLFNSLNTLSDLIHSDQDMASKFVDEMSSVFRYVLDSNKKDLVSDVKELKFLNSYMYLQKKRFGEGLICEVYSEPSDKLIPPLSLYMLVENAIKHNSISTSKPLTIRILKREDCLIVENNIQKKDIPQNESTKMGLKNLEERYRHFNTTQFKIEENTGKFIVTLPLL
ncbi:MAG: histidine kinase [Cyclobacteriaceae bacterium]|nr:histidine kinase [Cyclobacteriaceae bacterium]